MRATWSTMELMLHAIFIGVDFDHGFAVGRMMIMFIDSIKSLHDIICRVHLQIRSTMI